MGTDRDKTFEELITGLNPLQLAWVRRRIAAETKSDRQASREVGIDKDSPGRWKADGIPLDEIVEAARRDSILLVREQMKRDANEAYEVKRSGLHSKDEHIRQSVSSEILDRILGKVAQTVRHTGDEQGPPIRIVVAGIDLSDDV